ncbi:penicillin-binding protein 1C [Flavobacterium sp. JP2137]|uniref:penicillin-binding protein 1C n=1 Tax=Flavobacterium sp. JP2137 TaxID=3414510 RepID=UPI003D2FBA28
MKTAAIPPFIKRHKIKSLLLLALLISYYFCLPKPLFDKPYSTVIESREGYLLGAQIARDGQWRFPEQDSIPHKFKQSIRYFEDEHFYRHWGINPVAIAKAIAQNIRAGKVVRGGSTLTQQTIRLARDGKKRSYFEKLIEAIQSTRLEFRYSKDRILTLYTSQAPFGGNVVGLDMASWRYFGVSPQQLSWAESATLAVLPNAPKLIYPGKNQQILLAKRNALLLKLHRNHVIDAQTYELALEEPLPQKPHPLPQLAPHLLTQVAKKTPQQRVQTTLDYEVQRRANQLAQNYHNLYSQSEIHNLAILVIDVNTRNTVAYIGNAPTTAAHQKDVDIIQAARSTGSILKPFLYAAVIDEAELLPETLIPDVPTQISGYSPKNYNLSYEGAVPANRALSRSLNIPSVLMLQDYGVYRFYEQLQKLQLRHINKHPNHYGLSLILGGAESSLWDLCQAYAGMSSTLNYFVSSKGKYRKNEMTALNWNSAIRTDFGTEAVQKTGLGAGAIWQTFEAMREVNRPEGDEAWKFYDSSLQIAWKTGTSFGNRDGWAIGVNKDYVVGIWVGNATGEGRPSLTGVSSAAPILFDVFNLLPRSPWFDTPYNDLEEADICVESGYLAQQYCPSKKGWIVARAKKTKSCPYHFLVHLDANEQYRVNSSCESIENIRNKSWFQIPPIQAFYYKNYHVNYIDLPPFRADCLAQNTAQLDFIYPKHQMTLYRTKDFHSNLQPFVAKAAASSGNKTLFWYLDNQYLGATTNFHEFEIKTTTGTHILSITDTHGNEKAIEIYVNGK